MLEAAATPAEDVQEDVAPVRQAAPEDEALLDDHPQVCGGPGAVPFIWLAHVHQHVRHALHRELVGPQVAGDDG